MGAWVSGSYKLEYCLDSTHVCNSQRPMMGRHLERKHGRPIDLAVGVVRIVLSLQFETQ